MFETGTYCCSHVGARLLQGETGQHSFWNLCLVVSYTLAEVNLEVPGASKSNLAFCLGNECKWWICFVDKKRLHHGVKELSKCWE